MTADSAPRLPALLLVGGGFLGEAAADLFHAQGWRVTAWTATAESAARLAAVKGYPVRPRDIARADFGGDGGGAEPEEEIAGCDVVIQCVSAGRGGGAEAYRRVYLEGARHLLAALRRRRSAARLLFVGSTSVYAQTDGDWVSEIAAAEPKRETGRVLRETEALVLAQPGGTVARLAGLYGPGRSVLLKKFLAGEATVEGDGGRWLNQIHRDDAARALLRLAQPDASGGIFNVADDTPLTQLALYRGLAARLGRPLPPFGPPDLGRKRGWTSKRVANAKLRALGGWAPRFPSFFDALDGLLSAR